MQISRHYLTVTDEFGSRRVHYRRCGMGPVLLMVHQSPRSSREYEALMRAWGQYFTCIAPDTPGFGQSDPLRRGDPDIGAYADALAAFVRALGLSAIPAYGFHSGGIILVAAMRRHPGLFGALAIGGYAVWTAEEMRSFGEAYLPAVQPASYGEHLVWLWNRVLEQSWFFPWYDARDAARLSVAHDDPARVHAVVSDMLDSGDAWRQGYGAVLRAPRDIPPSDTDTAPVLITAYDGDPLQAHLARLGELPPDWRAEACANPAEHQARSLAFLREHGQAAAASGLPEDMDAGFLPLSAPGFDGLIHWSGDRGAPVLRVHAPGLEMAARPGEVGIDLPGHGLSDGWDSDAPEEQAPWDEVVEQARRALGAERVEHDPLPEGEAERLYPDLTPDRFGAYLTRAWAIVRARVLFAPWYAADSAHARSFDPDELAPETLAQAHRALIRATAARAWHVARSKEKVQ